MCYNCDMNFIQIDSEQFRRFADKSKYKSFMQTPEIAQLREQNGWTPYYFAVESDNKIQAAAMLVARPTFLGKSTYLCPGGPLLDLENTELTKFFFTHLRRYVKSHNGYVLHIDPYYEVVERDRDGNPVDHGFNHEKAKRNLRNLGFISAKSTQPKYLFVMDFEKRTEDQLISDLKRNTRNHIRKADKAGVTVRELKREELDILKKITESTSKRRNFTDRSLSYYEQMYDLFHPRKEVKFLVAEIRNNKSENYTKTETIIEAEGVRSAAARGVAPSARGDGPDGRAPKLDNSSVTVPLSAAMFMLYGDEVIYLFSGSDEKYMKEYNAQYAIQWHIIKYAATHGFKRYNFYGISGLPKNGELDGIYEFKKGFDTKHGKVVELIGSYELPTNQLFYQLHQLLSKLKHR